MNSLQKLFLYWQVYSLTLTSHHTFNSISTHTYTYTHARANSLCIDPGLTCGVTGNWSRLSPLPQLLAVACPLKENNPLTHLLLWQQKLVPAEEPNIEIDISKHAVSIAKFSACYQQQGKQKNVNVRYKRQIKYWAFNKPGSLSTSDNLNYFLTTVIFWKQSNPHYNFTVFSLFFNFII